MSGEATRPDARPARAGRAPVRVGDWLLLADVGVLRRGAEEVRLHPKALHVLLVLIDADAKGVSRGALLDAVWGSGYPSEAVVSRAIADLRAAFGESAGQESSIRTLPKFGYQLVAPVTPVDEADTAARNIHTGWRWLSVLVVVTLLAMAAGLFSGRSTDSNPVTPNLAPVARPLTSAPGIEHQARIAASGEWVAYAAVRPGQLDWDLFRVSLADGSTQAVAATPGVHEHGPAVSPLSDEIAYVRMAEGSCDIVTQAITLGVPNPIARCTQRFPTTVDWSPDGRSIVFTAAESDDETGRRSLQVVDRYSGLQATLTEGVSATGTDYYPRYSPGGGKVVFFRGEPQPDHRAVLWLVNVETGVETQLTRQPGQLGGVTWLNETALLYSVNDGGRFETRILDLGSGSNTTIEVADLIHPDYSSDGSRLVATRLRNERDLVLVAKDGSSRALVSSTSDDHHGVLSPDESLIAFISRRSGHDELWVADIETETQRRLTQFDGNTLRYPDWHPDGSRLLFTAQTEIGERLFEVELLSGAVRPLGDPGLVTTTPRWLPDGSHWVFGCSDDTGWGVCIGDSDGHRRIADKLFRPEPVDASSVAVVDSSGVLYRLNPRTEEHEVIFDRIPDNGRNGWTIANDDLIYIRPAADGAGSVVARRNLRDATEVVLFEGDVPAADVRIDVGRSTGDVLLTRYLTPNDDLVVYDLTPTGY